MTALYHGSSFQEDLAQVVGNTPLIRLRRASEATGCTILGKAEFMNPGGSVKDRAGLAIITDAEQTGALREGGTIVEGTAGNTGIGLTLVGNARGYKSVIVMPETQSQEKIDFLRMIDADLRLVPAKPYRDPGNYVHVSRRLAEELAAETGNAIWANQFDNLANREGHRMTTGPEIWDQTEGRVTHSAATLGTSGTFVGTFHQRDPNSPNVLLRQQLHALAEEHGVITSRPGARSEEQVFDALKSYDPAARMIETAAWSRDEIPAEILLELDRQIFSETWMIPRAVMDILMPQLRGWAKERFGTLDGGITVHYVVRWMLARKQPRA